MLLFEVQSINYSFSEEDIFSEILESENNKTAYKAAMSLARYYAREYNCYASVVAHNSDNYNSSAFTCFYASPNTKRYASAEYDAMGFYMCDWRKGY